MVDSVRQELQRMLLKELERSSVKLELYRDVLSDTELKLLEWVKECTVNRTVGPYKTVVMYSKMVESLHKQESLRLAIYDRLSGVVTGQPIPDSSETDEEVVLDDTDIKIRRQAERLCLELAERLYPPETIEAEFKVEEE